MVRKRLDFERRRAKNNTGVVPRPTNSADRFCYIASHSQNMLALRQTRGLSRRYFKSGASFATDAKPLGVKTADLIIGVPKETFPLEKRVAATPGKFSVS